MRKSTARSLTSHTYIKWQKSRVNVPGFFHLVPSRRPEEYLSLSHLFLFFFCQKKKNPTFQSAVFCFCSLFLYSNSNLKNKTKQNKNITMLVVVSSLARISANYFLLVLLFAGGHLAASVTKSSSRRGGMDVAFIIIFIVLTICLFDDRRVID